MLSPFSTGAIRLELVISRHCFFISSRQWLLPSASVGSRCQASPFNTFASVWLPEFGSTASTSVGHVSLWEGRKFGACWTSLPSSRALILEYLEGCEGAEMFRLKCSNVCQCAVLVSELCLISSVALIIYEASHAELLPTTLPTALFLF
jgi:hypothetical protein